MMVKSFCTTCILSNNSQFFLYILYFFELTLKHELKSRERKLGERETIMQSETNKQTTLHRKVLLRVRAPIKSISKCFIENIVLITIQTVHDLLWFNL